MNVKILDSWLREYLKTNATPQKIAEIMSLTSVGIERIEEYKKDKVYDIEVTTNRPDLLSVIGLAREAATALQQAGIQAEFVKPSLPSSFPVPSNPAKISVINDPDLVYRVCAVVMEVSIKESPLVIKDRLEASGIRSLNNIIDVTNYVMRVIGHPTHVFDFDRLNTKKLKIREAKKGEKITTLDGKKYTLPGGDIVAVNDKDEIVDLLGIMGLENSVVTKDTKRILFFIDNNDANKMRKTSMNLAIRTEAVQMNEKHIDPELAMEALKYGIQLYEQLAHGKVISELIDIYPHPYVAKKVTVTEEKIHKVIGVPVSLSQSAKILNDLGFDTELNGTSVTATVPSYRAHDVEIEEDLIEEIARIYGYHNIPSSLTPLGNNTVAHYADNFYWEKRVKDLMKSWGFTEVYTYSMVSRTLLHDEPTNTVTIKNPLNEDLVYMRTSLKPSLLQILEENKKEESITIFEIAHTYKKRKKNLPEELLTFGGVIKKRNVTFFEVKGMFEQIAKEFGIKELQWKLTDNPSIVEIFLGNVTKPILFGSIVLKSNNIITFECDFSVLTDHATLHKTFTPLAKYPPILEDMSFLLPGGVTVGDIMAMIKKQSSLITKVTLIDKYEDSRTFRIMYQHPEKNLTSDDVTPVREKISHTLKEKLHVVQK